jgi:steroid delta-isomerase-like uncharacterized protein
MHIGNQKSLVIEYIEKVWNRGDMAALQALTTPSFRYHLGGQAPRDHEGMRLFLAMTRSAFPDWRVDVLDVTGEGDSLAVRWGGTVTHDGAFHGIEPTGRKIQVSGINMYRIHEGRICDEWEQTDSLGMVGQLGVLPST